MGILLVYDVTNIDSFTHLPYWMKTIQEVSKFLVHSDEEEKKVNRDSTVHDYLRESILNSFWVLIS